MSAELGQRGQPSPITDEVVSDRLRLIEAAARRIADDRGKILARSQHGLISFQRALAKFRCNAHQLGRSTGIFNGSG